MAKMADGTLPSADGARGRTCQHVLEGLDRVHSRTVQDRAMIDRGRESLPWTHQ